MITSLSIGTGGLGRFGNQMFTIAGVIGIAIKSGQPFAFPKWKNYDNALFGGEVTDFEQFFENKLPEIPEQIIFNDYGYFWGYRDINLLTGNWSINAHLQSGKYFEHCIDTVRHYFKMKDESEQNECVAIHVRFGDYQDGGKSVYHPRCTMKYYSEALKHIPDNCPLILFSDDIDNAYKMFIDYDEKYKYILCKDNSINYIESFKKMKRCKHFIISNSSFSGMAAHLGEYESKIVVSPSGKTWFGEVAGINGNDIINEKWISVDIW